MASIAAAVYLAIGGGLRCDYAQSEYSHHIQLADAFLHGQLYVRPARVAQLQARDRAAAERVIAQRERETGLRIPAHERALFVQDWIRASSLQDWSVVNGRLYGYWGPLTPALLVPVVALFGPDVSDRAISACVGAGNVLLLGWLLRRVVAAGLLRASAGLQTLLLLIFAFGTVHFYIACLGRVWLSVQLVTLTAILAALLVCTGPRLERRHALLAGIFFGGALLARNFVALAAPVFITLLVLRGERPPRGRRALAVHVALFLVPCVAAAGLQAAYNLARFGDAGESGQDILMRTTSEARFIADYERWGQFHPHFLGRNAHHYIWNVHFPVAEDGRRVPDPDGNSMFLITPPLLYALRASRQRGPLTLALLCGVAPFLSGLLLFRATGYTQFGNRYLLEILPLLLLLVIAGTRGGVTGVFWLAALAALAVNAWGVHAMCFEPGWRVAWVALWGIEAVLAVSAVVGGGLLWRRGRVGSAAPPKL